MGQRHEHEARMTIHLYETFKLPISSATADFNVAGREGGTELTLHYSYEPNLLGKVLSGYTEKQLRQGIGGLATSLAQESERLAAA